MTGAFRIAARRKNYRFVISGREAGSGMTWPALLELN